MDGVRSAWLCLSRREWVEDTQLWIQQVSSTPSTRMDVVHLQEQLDLKLQQRQARETGICPVRRELYSQCFGERSSREATPPSTASFPSLRTDPGPESPAAEACPILECLSPPTCPTQELLTVPSSPSQPTSLTSPPPPLVSHRVPDDLLHLSSPTRD